jgi:hypothetical protein
MQFKHPEILYALLLLVIPIIVHLFQLRRFQKEAFTNVAFLKSVIIQTRKSSQIKKWLTLLTRLGLLACIIIAFAQPFSTKNQNLDTQLEHVIYLDNSFSMQAKGNKGPLLKRAIQELITSIDNEQEIQLFTNDHTYRNTSLSAIKNELIDLDYSANQLDYEAVLIKGKQLFSKSTNAVKNLTLISDFQEKAQGLSVPTDSLIRVNLVQLQPESIQNISLDSAYINTSNATNINLEVRVQRPELTRKDLSISLFENERLIAKTTVSDANNNAQFTLPANQKLNGKIVINDESLQFDNTLFFNINTPQKIKVLSINASDDNFLSRIYTAEEFTYESVALEQLNFNLITDQNLIILNEITSISIALQNALQDFTTNGGYLLIIPSETITTNTYNQALKQTNLQIGDSRTTTKNITSINYEHPLLENVFEERVRNFQYPRVQQHYGLQSSETPILSFEDGRPFLVQSQQVFLFSAALNTQNSNFSNSQLIVPVLYNIGKQSLQLPRLYYTIGQTNQFDINATLGADEILSLKTPEENFIPQQQTLSNKVSVTTSDLPMKAATFEIVNNNELLEHISFNYPRQESLLRYQSLNTIENVQLETSIPQLFASIKNDTNNNALWKWFVIFALAFLVIEMLILKYFK